MGQSSNDPTLLLTFSDGKTATQTQSAYEADPLMEVRQADGTRKIMLRSEARAMLIRGAERLTARISELYMAGRELESLQSRILGIGIQAQEAMNTACGALGSNQAAQQLREHLHQAAPYCMKLSEVSGQTCSTIGGGLIHMSSLLLEMEQKNLAPFGLTATDPRLGLDKILALEAQGE